MTLNVHQTIVTNADGGKTALKEYAGTVLLIVNVASRCGFTKQYEGLQALQEEYGAKGFQVLAFPCNDYGNQEPGTLDEIKTFCSTTYKISFPIFEKVHAKGKTTEPFTTLNKFNPAGDVEWNFEKFLINKKGEVIKRFKSSVEPTSDALKQSIEEAIKQ